jgi:hypothetical protein
MPGLFFHDMKQEVFHGNTAGLRQGNQACFDIGIQVHGLPLQFSQTLEHPGLFVHPGCSFSRCPPEFINVVVAHLVD